MTRNIERLITLGAIMYSVAVTKIEVYNEKALKKTSPENINLRYIDNDTLPDIVYRTGEIFLQTKNGTFVSYDTLINQEKRRMDSIYQAKQDSIKKSYESQLERKITK